MERSPSDPLVKAGFTPHLVELVSNALKRGRNGTGVEQQVNILPDAQAILGPADHARIAEAVSRGDVAQVATELRDVLNDKRTTKRND